MTLLARLGYEVKSNYVRFAQQQARKIEAKRVVQQQTRKRNKYGAKRVGNHASEKEHDRASELKLMQRAGLISNLREQVSFTLIPEQYVDCGVDDFGHEVRALVERPCRYIADFVYTDKSGKEIVEDTKGYRTKEYIIKRKLMLYIHGIRIKEV